MDQIMVRLFFGKEEIVEEVMTSGQAQLLFEVNNICYKGEDYYISVKNFELVEAGFELNCIMNKVN